MTEPTAEQQAAAVRADMRRALIDQHHAASGPNATLEDAVLVVDTALAVCDEVGKAFTDAIENRMKIDDDVLTLSLPISVLATQLVMGAMQQTLQRAIDQARALGIQPVRTAPDQRSKAN